MVNVKEEIRKEDIQKTLDYIDRLLIEKNIGMHIYRANGKNVIGVYDGENKKDYLVKLDGGLIDYER